MNYNDDLTRFYYKFNFSIKNNVIGNIIKLINEK